MFMDYVNCTGWEGRLWEGCAHYAHSFGCSHNDDVGVQCAPGDIINLLVECTKSKGMEQERDFCLCHLQLAVPMISLD